MIVLRLTLCVCSQYRNCAMFIVVLVNSLLRSRQYIACDSMIFEDGDDAWDTWKCHKNEVLYSIGIQPGVYKIVLVEVKQY